MTNTTTYLLQWTKISNGCYRLNGTDYEAVKDECVKKTRWWIYRRGVRVSGIESEPSRQFAGYAIHALIAAADNGFASRFGNQSWHR